jgi:hypothetical protein
MRLTMTLTKMASLAIRPETEHNNFWGGLKLIAAITGNAEFTLGVRLDLQKK